MSVDLTDPNIPAAYSEVIGEAATNWLLLGYGATNAQLLLYDTGSRGLEELRGHLGEEVVFGLLNFEGRILLLVYMPDSVSGVKRARALVHSRAVGNAFKAHHAVLMASRPSQVEEDDVREKLGLRTPVRTTNVVYTKSSPSVQSLPPTPPLSAPRLSATSQELQTPSPVGKPPAVLDHRSSSDSRASSLQQRTLMPNNARQASYASSPSPRASSPAISATNEQASDAESGLPPVPPKSDYRRQGFSTPPAAFSNTLQAVPDQQQGMAQTPSPMLPSTIYPQPQGNPFVGGHRAQAENGTVAQPPDDHRRREKSLPGPPQTEAQLQAAISRAKWEAEEQAASSPQRVAGPVRVDPAAFAEAERQKREKELHDRAQMDAEEQRRLEMERVRRQEAARRLQLEEARRAAEAKRRSDEAEADAYIQRKRQQQEQERQSEIEEHIRQQRLAEEDKRRQRERWMAERASLEEKFKELQVAGKAMLTGWASHQVGVIWRRRYFEIRPDFMVMFKNAEEINKPVATLSIADIQGIQDARDDLELPNSLRVDLKEGDPAYFHCDSQKDKEVLAAALRQAAGL